MKFVLAFSICSALTGFCNNTFIGPERYNSWAECVSAGGKMIIMASKDYEEKFNKEKLYISYFCNENNPDESTTPSKPLKKKI